MNCLCAATIVNCRLRNDLYSVEWGVKLYSLLLLTEFSELSTVELRPSMCVSDLYEPSPREPPHAARQPDRPQRRHVSSADLVDKGHEEARSAQPPEPAVPYCPPTEPDRVPRRQPRRSLPEVQPTWTHNIVDMPSTATFRELLDAEGRRPGQGRARRPATTYSDQLAATETDYKTPKAHNPAAKRLTFSDTVSAAANAYPPAADVDRKSADFYFRRHSGTVAPNCDDGADATLASFHRQVQHGSSTYRRSAGSDVTMVSSEPNYENHRTRRDSTGKQQSPYRDRGSADVRQQRTLPGSGSASTRRHRRHSSDSSTPTGSDSDLPDLTGRRASRRSASLTRYRQRHSDL